MDDSFYIGGEITIKNRLTNTMKGRFILYQSDDSDLSSDAVIRKPDSASLNSLLSARKTLVRDTSASLEVKYFKNEDLEANIAAMAGDYLDSFISVRPHNQAYGRFELHEAPRMTVNINPVADASTRSRPDLETINYGDTRSMLTGQSGSETFEAFVRFEDLNRAIPDMKYVEDAKLRLYFSSFANESLELHRPNTMWQEYGVTHASKPFSVEKLHEDFLINRSGGYVEFDVLSTVLKWQDTEIDNTGFIIKTLDQEKISFFTRESEKPPQLIVKYITSQVYSIGQSDLELGMFIQGKGQKNLNSYLTVHSDIGLGWQEGNLYVHRREDPLYSSVDSQLSISRADVNSSITVYVRHSDDIDSTISVRSQLASTVDSLIASSQPDFLSLIAFEPNISLASSITIARVENNEVSGNISVSSPEISSWLTVDPNISLVSFITVAKAKYDDFNGYLIISNRDVNSTISTSIYKRNRNELDGQLIVKTGEEEFLESIIRISKPDMHALIAARANGDSGIDSEIEIPFYHGIDSDIIVSHPDMDSLIKVKYSESLDSEIEIKKSEYLASIIDIRKINQLSSLISTRQITELETNLGVSHPDLSSVIIPRVIGLRNLDAVALIRQRDVTDLNSTIIVRGRGTRSYFYIM